MTVVRLLLFVGLSVVLSTGAMAEDVADIWTPPEIPLDPFGAWKDRQIPIYDPGSVPQARYMLLEGNTRVTGSVADLADPSSSIVVADKRCDPELCVVGLVVGYELPAHVGDTDLALDIEGPEGTVVAVAFHNRTAGEYDLVGELLVSRSSPVHNFRMLPTADPDYRDDSSVVDVLLIWAWAPEPPAPSVGGSNRGNDAVIVKNATLGPPS